MTSRALLELGRRLQQPEEEWRDKCAAFVALRDLLNEEDQALAPDGVQTLAQPFRKTLTDLRSTVVKEACATLSLLARTLGPARCKILVRDVFPTLLEARGGSNKVNTAAIHCCIEAIVDATPSRFVLAPVLQVLDVSKNREVRESCIHYTHLALTGWSRAVLERFKIPLQTALAAALSDASSKGREKARDCYWRYLELWPDEAERMNKLLGAGVKKHLKRSRKEAGLAGSPQSAKRRHLATITNTVSAISTAKSLFTSDDCKRSHGDVKQSAKRLGVKHRSGPMRVRGTSDSRVTPPSSQASASSVSRESTPSDGIAGSALPKPSRIPSTPTSALKKTPEGKVPSKIPKVNEDAVKASPISQEPDNSHLLNQKLLQLQQENTALRIRLEKHVQDTQRLQEQAQMLSEEKTLIEKKNQESMAAVFEAHAQETSTQQQIQYELAERVASLESELEEHQQKQKPNTSATSDPENPANSNKSDKVEGSQVCALQSERSALEERLSARDAELAEVRAEQSAAMAALEEQKRALESEVSALKSGQSDVAAQCNEKDERVTQLESELSAVQEQLRSVTSKLEAASTESSEQVCALQSERSALEERRLSSSIGKENKVSRLASPASGLSRAKLSSRRSYRASNLEEDSLAEASKPRRDVPAAAFSFRFSRDRSEVADEERRLNEANLLKRRMRRQKRQERK